MHITPRDSDIKWTVDGDLMISSTSDLAIADAFKDELLECSILRRLQSTHGDWALAPECGANLVEFAGWPNTPETAALIQSRIVNTLTKDLLLRSGEFNVEIYPSSLTTLVITIIINTIDPQNTDGLYLVGFSYDLRDNKLVPRIVND